MQSVTLSKREIPMLVEPGTGDWMHALIAEMYPICRSITGEGFRQTLAIVSKYLPLEMHHVPSGTAVFDWTIPLEWNIRDAYIKTLAGERIVDFRQSNLHVVSYSSPIRARVPLDELKHHLFTLPDFPERIPYRTSYYKRDWGFCVSHRQYLMLTDSEYEVCIDASLSKGHLTYGECRIAGATNDEILIWCHACHPSMCNDNLSGVALLAALGRILGSSSRRYSYRLVLAPGTIGAITWLSRNADQVQAIKHGLVLTCVGDRGHPTYKRSRRGADIDRAVQHVLRQRGSAFDVQDFNPYGYDERQFCSPGFNLPIGCFMRTPHARFPEYHTSADDLTVVTPEALADSLSICVTVFEILEGNQRYLNSHPWGEPQLGKRGLYEGLLGSPDQRETELAMLWVLNLSDGHHDLLDIAERANLPFHVVRRSADLLLSHQLLNEKPVHAAGTVRT